MQAHQHVTSLVPAAADNVRFWLKADVWNRLQVGPLIACVDGSLLAKAVRWNMRGENLP